MERGVSNQVVVTLALVLVLLVIGGTYLVLQEVRSVQQELAKGNQVSVNVIPPPRSASTGEVTVFVITPAQPQSAS